MKKVLLSLLFLLVANPVFAKEKVVTAYPYIADLVKQIAGNQVEVSSLASGDWDPHFIVPKPSLLSKLRQADLLIINGAQLEIGWLPPLLRQAANAQIQPGAAGFLELSNHVTMIQKPQNVSRAMGDVHPQGNPHFVMDPSNVSKMANAITSKLCQADPSHCNQFKQGNSSFQTRWKQSAQGWKTRMAKLKGLPVFEYHRLHDYFLNYYGLKLVATLEPLPGIPPTPQHLAQILDKAKAKASKVKLNLRGVYNPKPPSEFVSQKSGLKLVTLPHDVGATSDVKTIFDLYDVMLKRLGV